MKKTGKFLAFAGTLLVLSACGQKGPLFIPEEAEPNAATPATNPESAAPATENEEH